MYDGLWDIPINFTIKNLPPPKISQLKRSLKFIFTKDKSKKDLVSYLHACSFSPTKRAFLQAIKNGNFLTWPGLTYELVKKHVIIPPATAMGHLNQERQKLQSTSDNISDLSPDEINDSFPQPESSPPI